MTQPATVAPAGTGSAVQAPPGLWIGPRWLDRVRHPARARHHLATVLRSLPVIESAIVTTRPEVMAEAAELAETLARLRVQLGAPPSLAKPPTIG